MVRVDAESQAIWDRLRRERRAEEAAAGGVGDSDEGEGGTGEWSRWDGMEKEWAGMDTLQLRLAIQALFRRPFVRRC